MITREQLIYDVAMAMAANAVEKKSEALDMNAMAEVALDTVMAKVAEPLINILEDASPFGKIAADQIKSIAGKK